MIFAETDAQYLWEKFGWEGFTLLLLFWLTPILLQIWATARINANLESLKRTSEREAIRFSRLHDKRALIIKELYDKIVACSEAGMDYVAKTDDASKKIFFRSQLEFAEYFKTNKLYFSVPVCEKIQEVTMLMFHAVGTKFANPHREKEMSEGDKLIRDYNCLAAVSPSILAELEREFRLLLGVEVDPIKPVRQPTFINPKKIREIRDSIKK